MESSQNIKQPHLSHVHQFELCWQATIYYHKWNWTWQSKTVLDYISENSIHHYIGIYRHFVKPYLWILSFLFFLYFAVTCLISPDWGDNSWLVACHGWQYTPMTVPATICFRFELENILNKVILGASIFVCQNGDGRTRKLTASKIHTFRGLNFDLCCCVTKDIRTLYCKWNEVHQSELFLCNELK